MRLDEIDKKILAFLQEDASLTAQALAKKINLSVTPCWRRLKRLSDEGYIVRKTAVLNARKLGLTLEVFVTVETMGHNEEWLDSFAQTMSANEVVIGCYRIAGSVDYLLHTIHSDMDAYDLFYKQLTRLPEIKNVSALIVMEAIKQTTSLPIKG